MRLYADRDFYDFARDEELTGDIYSDEWPDRPLKLPTVACPSGATRSASHVELAAEHSTAPACVPSSPAPAGAVDPLHEKQPSGSHRSAA